MTKSNKASEYRDKVVSNYINSITTVSKKVVCDGTGDALGHPKIYMEMTDDNIACSYCGKIFTYKKK